MSQEIRIKTESIPESLRRMERFVQRFERRYEMTSDEMVELVKTGRFRETAEIGQWLTTYRRLKDFRDHVKGGATGGTHTIAI